MNHSVGLESCPEHRQCPLKYFCEDDNSVVCIMCAVQGSHKGHKCISLVYKNKECLGDVKHAVEGAKKVRARMRKSLKKIDHLKRTCENDEIASKEHEIRDYFKKIVAALQLRESHLIKQLHECGEVSHIPLATMAETLTANIETISTRLSDAGSFLNGDHAHKVINGVSLLNELRNYQGLPCYIMPSERFNSSVSVHLSPELFKHINEAGKIESVTSRFKLLSEDNLPITFLKEHLQDDAMDDEQCAELSTESCSRVNNLQDCRVPDTSVLDPLSSVVDVPDTQDLSFDLRDRTEAAKHKCRRKSKELLKCVICGNKSKDPENCDQCEGRPIAKSKKDYRRIKKARIQKLQVYLTSDSESDETVPKKIPKRAFLARDSDEEGIPKSTSNLARQNHSLNLPDLSNETVLPNSDDNDMDTTEHTTEIQKSIIQTEVPVSSSTSTETNHLEIQSRLHNGCPPEPLLSSSTHRTLLSCNHSFNLPDLFGDTVLPDSDENDMDTTEDSTETHNLKIDAFLPNGHPTEALVSSTTSKSLHSEPTKIVGTTSDTNSGDKVIINCGTVHVGSYKIRKILNNLEVTFTRTEIKFAIAMLGVKALVPISLKKKHVTSVLAFFGQNSMIFVYTSPGCGENIRHLLNMTRTDQPYYDPASPYEYHQVITFLPMLLTRDQKHFLTKKFPGPLLRKIEYTVASKILRHSSLIPDQNPSHFTSDNQDLIPSPVPTKEPTSTTLSLDKNRIPPIGSEIPARVSTITSGILLDFISLPSSSTPTPTSSSLDQVTLQGDRPSGPVIEPPENVIQIECHVQIGSYKSQTFNNERPVNVTVTKTKFEISANDLKENRHTFISVWSKDITSVLAHFGTPMSMLFVYTKLSCAGTIRRALNMKRRDKGYYDPCSEDESEKRIILFPLKNITANHKTFLLKVFLGTLQEIELPLSMFIMVKSKPHTDSDRGNSPSRDLRKPSKNQIKIKCRTIRIGSFNTQDYFKHPIRVTISSTEIKFAIFLKNLEQSHALICMKQEDILIGVAHFAKPLPVLFLYTKPGCGERLRSCLSMTREHGPYFDPCSSDETEMRITFLPNVLLEDHQIFLSNKFPGLLQEIDLALADRILARSTPIAVTRQVNYPANSKSKATIISQIVIKCRMVRIGSYETQAHSNRPIIVRITRKEITFAVKDLKMNQLVSISLKEEDIGSVMGHFEVMLPVLFINTLPTCGERIRSLLSMTREDQPYYDPYSSEESHRRISFFPYDLSKAQRNFLLYVFPRRLLQEIDHSIAVDILVLSTPIPTDVPPIASFPDSGRVSTPTDSFDSVEMNYVPSAIISDSSNELPPSPDSFDMSHVPSTSIPALSREATPIPDSFDMFSSASIPDSVRDPSPTSDSVDMITSQVAVPSESETEDSDNQIKMRCHSIRIGSYEAQALNDEDKILVTVTSTAIKLAVKDIEGEKLQKICLRQNDIAAVVAHFKRPFDGLPALFVFTTPTCGDTIRKKLNMTSRDKPYYDPCDLDPTIQWITISPKSVKKSKRKFLLEVFPGHLFQTIEEHEAKDILIGSAPSRYPSEWMRPAELDPFNESDTPKKTSMKKKLKKLILSPKSVQCAKFKKAKKKNK